MTLWQALLTVSQSPVDAGWLGIAFALGVVASFVVMRWRGDGGASAAPVEDDELTFVEEVVARATTRPTAAQSALGRGASVLPSPGPSPVSRRPVMPPPPVREPSLRAGGDQSIIKAVAQAGSEEAEEDQTSGWSRSEVLQGFAADREPPASTVAALRLAERPRRAASIRSMDVAAVRRRLQHEGRA